MLQAQARMRQAAELQATAHQAGLRQLSDASAQGHNVGAILPNLQAISLSAQQRALSHHRRLPSTAEHPSGAGAAGLDGMPFDADTLHTGMIGRAPLLDFAFMPAFR